MPVVSESALSTAGNAKSTDRLSGSQLGYSPDNVDLSLYCKASATGLNVTMMVGGEVVINDQPIAFTGTAGTLDITANVVGEFAAYAGEQLQLFFRNTTAGALTVDYVLKAE